jgi:chorismate mutase
MIENSRNGSTPDADAPLVCRGVRGATTVTSNTAEAVLEAARELLLSLVEANGMEADDMASIHFTTTADLNATYPALAARRLGWYDVALLCSQEIDVPGGLPRCLRVLIHWNSRKRPHQIHHVYLHDAVSLRPDRRPPSPMIAREKSDMAVRSGASNRPPATIKRKKR